MAFKLTVSKWGGDQMRWLGIMIVLFVMVSGCLSATSGRPFNAEARKSIRVNVTTKEQIRQMLGEPFAVSINNKTETWEYQHVSVTVEAFAQTVVDSSPETKLTLIFGNGVVVSCNYFYQETTKGIVSGQPTKTISETCGKSGPKGMK